MKADTFRRRLTVHYDENVMDDTGAHVIGKRRLECAVEVTVNLEDVAQRMGSRACRNAGGVCQDGPVRVKRIGVPRELSKKMLTGGAT